MAHQPELRAFLGSVAAGLIAGGITAAVFIPILGYTLLPVIGAGAGSGVAAARLLPRSTQPELAKSV